MAGKVHPSASVASIDPNSYVQLRWDQIQAPYAAVLDGRFNVETVQAFCAAIRWAYDQYHATSYRFPERLESGAAACIKATEQVLKIAHALGGKLEGEPAARAKVLAALERHLRNFQEAVVNSKKRTQKLVA